MKITVWGINYHPEPTGIGPFNTDLCDFLKEQGNQVAMITSFPYYPKWEKQQADHGKFFETSDKNGVRVHRCWHYVPRKPSTLKRLLHELSFVATSFLRSLTLPAPDIFIIVSPPLFLGGAAWLASRLLHRPYVFHVQDLQPDAALGLGMIKPGPAVRALYRLERWTYRGAATVSGISRGMLEAFDKKAVPAEKIYLFPNWIPDVSPDLSRRSALGDSFRAAYGLAPNTPLIAYSGNIGAKQGLEVIVEAAARAEKNEFSNAAALPHWAICGDGSAKSRLQELIDGAGTSGVRLYPLQPDNLYHALLTEADVCLITQQRGTGQFFFPSKLLSILQYGRPVLAVADDTSELARAVREGQFGLVVPSGVAQQLVAAAKTMIQATPAQRDRWAANGRAWVDQFRRKRVLHEFFLQLTRLARSSDLRAGGAGPSEGEGTSVAPAVQAEKTALAGTFPV